MHNPKSAVAIVQSWNRQKDFDATAAVFDNIYCPSARIQILYMKFLDRTITSFTRYLPFRDESEYDPITTSHPQNVLNVTQ